MTSELTGFWFNWIANRCICRAADAAPPVLNARLREEWLATAAEIPDSLSRLRFAFGCCWAVQTIAREHSEPLLVTPAVTAQRRRFIRLPTEEFPLLTGGAGTFILVVSLNAALLFGVAAGLGPQFIKRIAGAAPALTTHPGISPAAGPQRSY